MSSSKVFTQAICLRQTDWSETSQIATLLTQEHGVIRAIAKGSRRWNAPFSGGVEVLTRGEVAVFLKPARELQLISEWDLQETFPAGRHHWRTHCLQLLAVEVALRLVPAGPESTQAFEHLLSLLRQFEADHEQHAHESHGPSDWWLAVYLWQMLDQAGHAPDLASAPPTEQTKGAASDVALFAPELGRWLSPREQAATTWAMRRETLTLLREVATAGMPQPTDHHFSTNHETDNPRGSKAFNNPKLPRASLARAGRFLVAFLEYVSGQEIRTASAIFEDNAV